MFAQIFSQDYDLASHTIYVVYVNFIEEWRAMHSFKSTPNDRFFSETFSCKFYISLAVFFARNLLLSYSKTLNSPTLLDFLIVSIKQ